MSNNWMTMAEAVTLISKNSHHQVSHHHVQTLVNRRKIGVRSFHGEATLLKCSDVKSTRVAIHTGRSHRRDKAALKEELPERGSNESVPTRIDFDT